MNFINIINDVRLNGSLIENQFMNFYYQNMVNNGFSHNLSAFDENCRCSFNNEEFIGAYNVLVKLAQNNIYRYSYKTLQGVCQPSQNGFLITVSGICQLINFQNVIGREMTFIETFFISSNTNKICNYISRLL